MADKLLLVSAFVVLSLPGIGLVNRIPVWLTVLVISRDVAIVATVAIVSLAMGRRTFPPSIYGKIATATYIVTIAVVLLFNFLRQTSVAGRRRGVGVPGDHADLGLPLHRARAPDAQRAASFVLKYSIVLPRPSSSETFGAHSRIVVARVMSGLRTFGSSTGSGLWTMRLDDPVSRRIVRAISSMVSSCGLPMLMGSLASGEHQADDAVDEVADVAEAPRLRAVAVHRDVLAA